MGCYNCFYFTITSNVETFQFLSVVFKALNVPYCLVFKEIALEKRACLKDRIPSEDLLVTLHLIVSFKLKSDVEANFNF